MTTEDKIAERIKEIRLQQGLTLKNLAEKTHFTVGYLSKVENSAKAPPVSTLIVLAKALNVTLSRILAEAEDEENFCLIKKNERREMAHRGTVFGYSYQTLSHRFMNKKMDPYILIIPLKQPKKHPLFQHEGEEMLFVLEGTMRFFHGENEYIVEEGDCIYFDSGIPHYGICDGDKEVKCVMVIYTPNHSWSNEVS
ncbi:MAG: helix-turn-helix transcriptional regulator [Deltaproteobacteria bacterium]|nr:helix-turn-helix transcriptional regulator [Deltaproteobacteria bacterium]